jgi:hypothetical protein
MCFVKFNYSNSNNKATTTKETKKLKAKKNMWFSTLSNIEESFF